MNKIIESFDIILDEATSYSSTSFIKKHDTLVDIIFSILYFQSSLVSPQPTIAHTPIPTVCPSVSLPLPTALVGVSVTNAPIEASIPNDLVGDFVVGNPIPFSGDHDDDYVIPMIQNMATSSLSIFHAPIGSSTPVANLPHFSSLSDTSNSYALNILSISFTLSPIFKPPPHVDEPLNPKFCSLIDLYSKTVFFQTLRTSTLVHHLLT